MVEQASNQDTQPIFQSSDPVVLADKYRKELHLELHERVGPYRIVHPLGFGGMGEVFLAEQTEPIHRQVALKVVKPGMATRDVLARFDREREALACMNHPNVAGVYDAGATERGQPYFAMEYVPGIAITDYCDKNRLDTEDRLHLFIDVCDAVQHAHQKGIIHRDLKPSNILVSTSGDKATPKVIDFGVAKATQHHYSGDTLYTATGQLIGTPGYTSPEQTAPTSLDIDTRTDIYSLGVILYELLVGALPFDNRKLPLDEMRRLIAEVDPPKPSTKFSSLGEAGTTIAHNRRLEPRTLARKVRGDLDWIVMKCLEKDRTRRYATANGLAVEIQRYLRNEPVLAGPPGVWYRTQKFARRHRAALITAAAFVLVLGFAGERQLRAREAAAELAAAAARSKAVNLLNEAKQLLSDNEGSEAMRRCEAAIALDSAAAEGFALRAKMRQHNDELKDSHLDCELALKLDPHNSLALRTLGHLKLKKRDYEGARDAFAGGFAAMLVGGDRLLPNDFHNAAIVLRVLGDLENALWLHDVAVALAPKGWKGRPIFNRAITRRFAGDMDGALVDLNKTGELDPVHLHQANVLAWEILMLRGAPGDRERAAEVLDAARAHAVNPLEKAVVGVLLNEVSEEEVLAAADDSTAITGKPAQRLRTVAQYYLGVRQLLDGKPSDAKAHFEKCVNSGIHDLPEVDMAHWHLRRLGTETSPQETSKVDVRP